MVLAMFKEKTTLAEIKKRKCHCQHGSSNYYPQPITKKCDIQGEGTS